ncbi:MAG: peptide ABC transporter ATP-binding protein [Phycisphaerae bacterium]|nr:peptide ABC transporter ATP-binding protein [Phycisphaerae bacterium]
MSGGAGAVLDVRGLNVAFGDERVVRGVDLTLDAGERLGIVGESGSGKSVTVMSLLGLVPKGTTLIDAERAIYRGRDGAVDLIGASERSLRGLRGGEIAMIFQEPMTSLNPLLRISEQIGEAVRLHQGVRTARAARGRVAEELERVGVAASRARSYPHEFSGGMRQRVMIAMALACRPRVLIADEPTTALDVTLRRSILDLIERLSREEGMGLVLISHDLGVVASRTDRVMVMRSGEVVESGETGSVLTSPGHAYTRGLLACVPRIGTRVDRLPTLGRA